MNGIVLAVILATATAAPTSAPGATVRIENFAFVPASISVAPGTLVRFVNDDAEAHTVTARDRSFDSAGLDTGDAWSYRFSKPGTYAYFCELHPSMKGTVIVR